MGPYARHLLGGLALGVAASAALPARASEGGVSLWVPGQSVPNGGILPPQGVYFDSTTWFYNATFARGGSTVLGGNVVANVRANIVADFVTGLWVTPVEILGGGARGYLLKSDADQQLVSAVEALAHHQPYFTGRVSQALLAHYLAHPGESSELDTLTCREREVVQRIAEGHSNKQVGEALAISLKTVEAHRASAMHKLGLTSTAALVRYAVRNKLVEP